MLKRVAVELRQLHKEPVEGIAFWEVEEGILTELKASITGVEGTPYAGGVFYLRISLSSNYPNEPPKVQMETKVYHPNIDAIGNICLNTLKLPPNGNWTPAQNLRTLLLSIQLLLSNPNPDDALVSEISREFKSHYELFAQRAREMTRENAMAQDQRMRPVAQLMPESSSSFREALAPSQPKSEEALAPIQLQSGSSHNSMYSTLMPKKFAVEERFFTTPATSELISIAPFCRGLGADPISPMPFQPQQGPTSGADSFVALQAERRRKRPRDSSSSESSAYEAAMPL